MRCDGNSLSHRKLEIEYIVHGKTVNMFIRQLDIHASDIILELTHLPRSKDKAIHTGYLEEPAQCDSARRKAQFSDN